MLSLTLSSCVYISADAGDIRLRNLDKKSQDGDDKVVIEENVKGEVVRLKRNVGLISGISVIVGTIIGK